MTKFFHKIILLLMLFLMVFCIMPFVVAENVENNNSSFNNNITIDSNSNYLSSNYDMYVSSDVNTSGNGSKSNPFKTVQEALNANTGGQSIYVSKGMYNISNYELTKNVKLIGENYSNTVISGDNATHIFIINNQVTINLNNLTFINGNTISSQEVGGAIQKNTGTLTINNCIFENNSAQYGGAIYNLIGELTVNNSKFINNSIINSGCDGGAAIYDLYGTGNIYNTLFIDNIAYKQNGGAIYQNKGYLNLYNSTFINNQGTGTGIGGAIYLNDRSYVNITDCTFKCNSASQAGAIYSANALNGMIGSCLIYNCIFDSNKANFYGGAIFNYWYYSLMTVENCMFLNNTAKYGGACYNQYSVLTLKNNTIKNCTASENGNEIYNDGILSNAYLTLLNNQTIKVENGEIVNITASLTDDNANTITAGFVNILVNGISINNLTVNEGSVCCNYTVNKSGESLIGGNYSQAQNTILKTAILDTNTSIETILIGENLIENYGQGLNYTAKLLDINGNPLIGYHVALNLTNPLNGLSKVYWVTTDTEGKLYLEINLFPGQYTVCASFSNIKGYIDSTCNNSIVVNNVDKVSTILSVNKFVGTCGEMKNLTGVLQTISGDKLPGQHVALNLTNPLNGLSKVYWATTDDKGEYQLPINLYSGDYIVKCSYSGSTDYASSFNSTSIIVNP